MKFLAIVLSASLLLSSAHAADPKYGVVDMVKSFTEFYKTKDASAKMKTNRDKANSELNDRYATYKTLTGEALKLGKEAQDPILTAAARQEAQSKYQEKVKEVNNLTGEIDEFKQRRNMQLRQEEAELQKGLYEEIVAVVKDKSKTGNYDLVFDKSGVSMNTVPVLIYFKDAVDFTDEVIVELNKNAPPPDAKKEETAEDKPKATDDKSKEEKEKPKSKSKSK